MTCFKFRSPAVIALPLMVLSGFFYVVNLRKENYFIFMLHTICITCYWILNSKFITLIFAQIQICINNKNFIRAFVFYINIRLVLRIMNEIIYITDFGIYLLLLCIVTGIPLICVFQIPEQITKVGKYKRRESVVTEA